MSSLNANTSGNADSATSIDAVDILNPYGDQVVTSFVEANRELLEQYNPRLVNLPQGDEATYFLGKLAVLTSDVAEQVIGQIEKRLQRSDQLPGCDRAERTEHQRGLI